MRASVHSSIGFKEVIFASVVLGVLSVPVNVRSGGCYSGTKPVPCTVPTAGGACDYLYDDNGAAIDCEPDFTIRSIQTCNTGLQGKALCSPQFPPVVCTISIRCFLTPVYVDGELSALCNPNANFTTKTYSLSYAPDGPSCGTT